MLGREASVLSTSSSSSESRESRESRDEECDALISPGVMKTLVKYITECSINLVLPFLNGLMLGFGELVAHEVCWQYKWFYHGQGSAHKVFPTWRKEQIEPEKKELKRGTLNRVTESWDTLKSKFL